MCSVLVLALSTGPDADTCYDKRELRDGQHNVWPLANALEWYGARATRGVLRSWYRISA